MGAAQTAMATMMWSHASSSSSLPTNGILEPTPAAGRRDVTMNHGSSGDLGVDQDGGVTMDTNDGNGNGNGDGNGDGNDSSSATMGIAFSQPKEGVVGVVPVAGAPSHPRPTHVDKGLGLDSALGEAWKPRVHITHLTEQHTLSTLPIINPSNIPYHQCQQHTLPVT